MPLSRYVLRPSFAAAESATAKVWLRQQFEFENCGECHRGERGHVAVMGGMGPFALCKPSARTTELSPMQKRAFKRRSGT